KLLTDPPTPLRSLRGEVPRAADAAVMRALAKDPGDRVSSAREFADGLIGPEPPATKEIAAEGRPPVTPTRRHRTVALAQLGLLAVAGAPGPPGGARSPP